jgi:hypothetical protein
VKTHIADIIQFQVDIFSQLENSFCAPNDHMSANSAGEIFALFAKIATAEFVSSMFVLGKMLVYSTIHEA